MASFKDKEEIEIKGNSNLDEKLGCTINNAARTKHDEELSKSFQLKIQVK